MSVTRTECYHALHDNRYQVLARGHLWDVADVMAVLDDLKLLPAA